MSIVLPMLVSVGRMMPFVIALVAPGADSNPATIRSTWKPDSLPPHMGRTTDTGEFAPGPRDFTRYRRPWQCLQAVRRTVRTAERTLSSPTSSGTVLNRDDMTLTPLIDRARQCSARFNVAQSDPVDLPELFALALAAHDDVMAHAVLRRRLALANTSFGRGRIFREAMRDYLAAVPARVTDAEALVGLAQTEQLGHLDLLRLVQSLLMYARETADLPQMQAYATQILTLARDMSPQEFEQASTGAFPRSDIPLSDEQLSPILQAYEALYWVAWIAGGPDSVTTVTKNAIQQLRAVSFRRSQSDERIAEDFEPAGLDMVSTHDSLPAAQYWIPAHPPQGRTTVIISLGALWDRAQLWSLGTWNAGIHDTTWIKIFQYNVFDFGARLVRPLESIRAWTTRYGGHNLSVVIAMELEGQVLNRTLPPREEAHRIAWFFRDYLGLPVTVAATVPAAAVAGKYDGTDCPQRFGPECHPYLSRAMTILDPHGIILYAGDGDAVAGLVLDRAFGKSPPPINTPGASR